jgi:sec-independent protein translocase protein TatC
LESFKEQLGNFFPFLEDLRNRLYRTVILFLASFGIGFLSAGVILDTILQIFRMDQVVIATTSPFQYVTVAMDIGFFLAIMVSVPYLLYSFYAFVLPALTRSEKIRLLKSIPVSLGLFIVGFLYGFLILYQSLGLLASVNTSLGVANIWNIGQFLSQIFITAALLGFVFEFPLFLMLLIKLGITTSEALKDKRRVAYFCMFCVTALLPPTDVLSLIAMALPLMVLYEVTLLLNIKK